MNSTSRMKILTRWLTYALAVPTTMTIIGLLAPYSPSADLFNHFRLHLMAVTATLLSLAILTGAKRTAWAAVMVLIVNATLAGIGFHFLAPPSITSRTPAKSVDLRILSFNINARTGQSNQIEDMLRTENADLVLLLEIDHTKIELLDRLDDLYPYQGNCVRDRLCRLALLSKYMLTNIDAHSRGAGRPAQMTAAMSIGGRMLDLYGVHLSRPFPNNGQHAEINHLIARTATMNNPLIMLGDFNLTPWSFQLLRLQTKTGLLRHATLGASWPTRHSFNLFPQIRFPQLLIDHVMTRGLFETRNVHKGRDAGSDHLPVIVDITWPNQ